MSDRIFIDRETWKILTEKIETFDEMGFPDIDGEYDINGFPLRILRGDK
jgi:hypothetical protein